MVKRKITIKQEVAEEIADIFYFIESKGMFETAVTFTKKIYSFIRNIQFDKIEFNLCKDPHRANLGLKCIPYNKKYTIVFYQLADEIIITEFISSKMLYW